MKAIIKVDSKGRIAIPKAIREKIGVKPGDFVAISLEEEKITVKPLRSTADKYYGAYRVEKWPENLDDFLAEALRKWWISRST